MAADLRITDGTPVWVSQSIIPSKDKVVSPGSSPTIAAITVNSTDIFVYVKVDNIGTVDVGACSCTAPVPAVWAIPVFFPGFLANPNGNATQTQAGVTFTASPAGDSLSGAVSYSFGVVASGRRAWAWSPDGRLFAHVASPNGADWYLTIVALQNITRSDGTVVSQGQAAVAGSNANGVWAGPPYWTNSNFGWAGSKAVLASGAYAGGGNALTRSLACPEAPGTNTWGELIPTFPGQIDWTYVTSPCGSVVAFVPKILQAIAGSRDAFLVSTATAKVVPFRQNNVAATVTIVGLNPSVTTLQHAAKGVRVNTGSGATIDVDDPDCTMVAGGGIVVAVDRVKASTLPTANLGVLPVGSATLGLLRVGQSQWVQVPNATGWANQSEQHWCLLAQAFTADGTTIPRPWNGQSVNPPPFPIAKQNCAQRNIAILP